MSNTTHIAGGVILVFFALLSFIFFKGRVTSRYLFALVSTCISLSIYCIFCTPGYFSIGLRWLICHKFTGAGIVSGATGIFYLLKEQKALPGGLYWISVTCATVSMTFILFGSTVDSSQMAVQFNYIIYTINLTYVVLKGFVDIRKKLNSIDIFALMSLLPFFATSVNDMLVMIGYWDNPMVFPLGIVSFLFLQGIYLEKKLRVVFWERDDLRTRLEHIYQEKIDLIQEYAVAHAVANTVQMIAHDIKKPFAILNAILHQIRSEKYSKEYLQKSLQFIEESSVYVDRLLANILTSGGESANRLEPIDLFDTVMAVWRRVSANEERGLEMSLDLRHQGLLFVDRLKVERLFANLFVNAMDAMGEDAKWIWVSSMNIDNAERRHVEVRVGNEGSYMAPEVAKEVFLKFYTKGKQGGNGLGLAICYEVVKSHGGTIECYSQEGKGTEFIFTLPVV